MQGPSYSAITSVTPTQRVAAEQIALGKTSGHAHVQPGDRSKTADGEGRWLDQGRAGHEVRKRQNIIEKVSEESCTPSQFRQQKVPLYGKHGCGPELDLFKPP